MGSKVMPTWVAENGDRFPGIECGDGLIYPAYYHNYNVKEGRKWKTKSKTIKGYWWKAQNAIFAAWSSPNGDDWIGWTDGYGSIYPGYKFQGCVVKGYWDEDDD